MHNQLKSLVCEDVLLPDREIEEVKSQVHNGLL